MLLGLGATAYFLLRKANAAGNLVFVPGNVTEVGTVDGNPYLDFTIIAQNTSNTDLLLNSFAANVFANGTLIGNVSNFSGVVIPANTSTAIPMSANMLLLGLVNDVILAFTNKSTAQNIVIEGRANVNSFQVPVRLEYNLGV